MDIHKVKASMMFNVSYNSVTSEQRKIAKIRNFILMYGALIPEHVAEWDELIKRGREIEKEMLSGNSVVSD